MCSQVDYRSKTWTCNFCLQRNTVSGVGVLCTRPCLVCVYIYLHCSAYCHACPGLHPVNYACISIDTKSCVVVSTFLFLSSSLLPLTLPSSLSLPLFLTPPPHSPFFTLPSSLPHSSPSLSLPHSPFLSSSLLPLTLLSSLSLPLFLTPPPHSPFLTLPSSLPHSSPSLSLPHSPFLSSSLPSLLLSLILSLSLPSVSPALFRHHRDQPASRAHSTILHHRVPAAGV